MSLQRDNKALNAKHAQILRELVRRPDNKICADCKRNDARWASVNLGVFMCIRCSGIHRSIGVHITRIKSVDLDTWTPEQIEVVQRWGNKRANLYWEAHLKAGHQPPEHKMESFIRSKYESRRWVLSPQIPDPDTLDGESSTTENEPVMPPTKEESSVSVSSKSKGGIDLLSPPAPAAPISTMQQQSSQTTSTKPPPSTSHPSGGGLFDLDFSPPNSNASTQAISSKQTSKADILSLFSVAPPPAAPIQQQQQGHQVNASRDLNSAFAGLDFGSTQSAPSVNQPSAQYVAPQQSQWSAPPASNWSTSFTNSPPRPSTQTQPTNNSFPSLFDSGSNPWGATSSTSPQAISDPFASLSSGNQTSSSSTSKNQLTFDDIWK